eukprot:Skav233394  [mRNA]  locus=scaffold1038:234581:241935:+ [translate_table: standard]
MTVLSSLPGRAATYLEAELRRSSSEAVKVTMQAARCHWPKVLRAALRSLTAGLTERRHEAKLLLLAAVAGEHILLIGPPGTGKSLLAKRLSAICGGKCFEHLMTPFTTPEEILGPISLLALQQEDKIELKTKTFKDPGLQLGDAVSFDWKDCQEACRAAKEVRVPSRLLRMVASLRSHLETVKPPTIISDRRIAKAMRLLQVAAFTCGADEVSELDLLLLNHVFLDGRSSNTLVMNWLQNYVQEEALLHAVQRGLRQIEAKAAPSKSSHPVGANFWARRAGLPVPFAAPSAVRADVGVPEKPVITDQVEVNRQVQKTISFAEKVLLSLPGIGPVLAEQLLNHFGNLEALLEAAVTGDELMSIPGIGPRRLQQIQALEKVAESCCRLPGAKFCMFFSSTRSNLAGKNLMVRFLLQTPGHIIVAGNGRFPLLEPWSLQQPTKYGGTVSWRCSFAHISSLIVSLLEARALPPRPAYFPSPDANSADVIRTELERTLQRAGEAADAIAEETEELAHGLSQLKAAIDSSQFRSSESRVGPLDAPTVGQSTELNIVQTAFPGRDKI